MLRSLIEFGAPIDLIQLAIDKGARVHPVENESSEPLLMAISKERTEMIVFMTPRVIYDTNDISEASDELKGRVQRLSRFAQSYATLSDPRPPLVFAWRDSVASRHSVLLHCA